MEASVIHYRLDLLVRLIDTTTGTVIEERNVQFQRDGSAAAPVPRGSGNYAFVNIGRENFSLQVKVFDYEPCSVTICYEELDALLPVKEVFLIPSENTGKGERVLTFSGKLSGLEAIEAVSLGKPGCSLKTYDERKRIITLLRTHGFDMEDIYYGLIHQERQTYEPFTVERRISEVTVKIKEPLQEEFSENAPITRIIFGKAEPDGSFLLRVRDNAQRLVCLIRYVVRGEVKFQVVDFHALEGVTLGQGG